LLKGPGLDSPPSGFEDQKPDPGGPSRHPDIAAAPGLPVQGAGYSCAGNVTNRLHGADSRQLDPITPVNRRTALLQGAGLVPDCASRAALTKIEDARKSPAEQGGIGPDRSQLRSNRIRYPAKRLRGLPSRAIIALDRPGAGMVGLTVGKIAVGRLPSEGHPQ
jgi:hypothetical protein